MILIRRRRIAHEGETDAGFREDGGRLEDLARISGRERTEGDRDVRTAKPRNARGLAGVEKHDRSMEPFPEIQHSLDLAGRLGMDEERERSQAGGRIFHQGPEDLKRAGTRGGFPVAFHRLAPQGDFHGHRVAEERAVVTRAVELDDAHAAAHEVAVSGG